MLPDYKLPWIDIARSHMGLREIPGKRSNKEIMSWASDIGGWIEDFYGNDDIPWCGLFVAHCIMDAGMSYEVKNPLGAKNWKDFGKKIHPAYGAIMVFSRSGGGHVGFYVSEDKSTYHILGGNQSNSVNITRVKKSRFIAARWPSQYWHMAPASGQGKIWKKFNGKISVNEA